MLPYFQGYYDLLPNAQMVEYFPWAVVSQYCRDLGIPHLMEDMFDVLRGIQRRVDDGNQ